MKHLGSSRIFASNYQLMITDSMSHEITDEINWTEDKTLQGYAGDSKTILVGTEGDLNDHWVDLYQTETVPTFDKYQRVFCLHFSCETGKIIVSSVIDDEASIEASLKTGSYTVYITAINLGVDQLSLGEESDLNDEDYKGRIDLERYSIFIVSGKPTDEGKIHDVS